MKNASDNNIGNRTRDLPACSAVLEPTAPPRTPTSPMLGRFASPAVERGPSGRSAFKLFVY